MKSLFARIWLSYWLVMVLILLGSLAISFALAVVRSERLDRLDPATMAASARVALATQGRDGLRGWLIDERHAIPELQIYFLDPGGRELLNRSLEGQALQGGAAPIAISAPDGTVYRMYVRRTSNFVFDVWNIIFQPYALLLLAVAASGLGSAWLSHHLTRPIVTLRAGVRAIASGNLDAQMDGVLTRRRDELGILARDFNSMAGDLRGLIASKDELLRDVSHELRSPLARLRVAAGLARRDGSVVTVPQFDRIDREVERLDRMIGQLLRFSRLARMPAPLREDVNLCELIESIVDDARIEADALGRTIDLAVEQSICAYGDPALIRSAFENVLRNAIRFAPLGSAVEVRLTAEPQNASIAISDCGPGVSEADLQNIFEPFFHTGSSSGAGLGLSIARRVFALHGGTIIAINRPGGGLLVRMQLPRSRTA